MSEKNLQGINYECEQIDNLKRRRLTNLRIRIKHLRIPLCRHILDLGVAEKAAAWPIFGPKVNGHDRVTGRKMMGIYQTCLFC